MDLNDLEIVAELLTTDASKVSVGNNAKVLGWGGKNWLKARVKKNSKAGYVKVSALGVVGEHTEIFLEPENLSSDW